MSDFMQDVVSAWRNALRRPATTLLIALTLALGIGANTAMFSMTWHVLLAPLPYAGGYRLVTLKQNETTAGVQGIPWMVPTVADVRAQNTVFSDVLGYVQLEYTLLGAGTPYFAKTGIVNADFFSVLGIEPLHGRGFTGADDQSGAGPVLLLGYDFWVSRFGADPDVLGSSLEMNAIVYTVVGVLPQMPPWPRSNDVWIPAAVDRVMSDARMLNGRSDSSSGIIWSVLGKLHDDATLETAERDVATITERLKTTYPEVYPPGYSIALRLLQEELRAESASIIGLLLALSALVLLIACANVANLNLASLSARQQELAIREATGANPARIRRQLFTESLLLALAGGMLGLAVAYPLLDLLAAFAADYTALAGQIGMNGAMLPGTLAIALLAGLLSGSVAAFRSRDINWALKEGGDKVTSSASATRGRQLLLVVQIGLSFVMLTTSALILLSLARLNDQDPGYTTAQVLTISTQLNQNYPSEQQGYAFVDNLLGQTRAVPGVESAAVAGAPLLQNPLYGLRSVDIEGNTNAGAEQRGNTFSTVITSDYFRVMGIPLLQGRAFTDADDENAEPVVIINQNFADRYFAGDAALGRRISFNDGESWRTVVGVVGNVRSIDLDTLEGAAVYTHMGQTMTSILNLFVKSRGSLDALETTVTGIVHDIDPELAIENAQPLAELLDRWLAPRRLVATLICLFGLLALGVTLAGVIGVVSYNISQRVREIGIHMAIGATPANIIGIFVTEGLKVYLAGLLLGLVLMLAATPFIEPLLYQTLARDAGIYLASALVLTLAVLLALYLPARKASALSPALALHGE